MKNHNNEVWKGVDDLTQSPEFLENASQEFVELPITNEAIRNSNIIAKSKSNRRDFLKFMGFSLGAATVAAGCEIPMRRAIPYVTKPDSIVPGIASYYASSFVEGGDYCSVLVKTREARPIKIEGNDLSQVTFGATSARAQGLVLSLYDTSRIKSCGILDKGVLTEKPWSTIDSEIKQKLSAASRIRIVSNSILSPTTKKAVAEFAAKYPNTKLVSYDPVSSSAILQANDICFADRAIPEYKFDLAEVIVSFGADFLGTWISPVEYAHLYAKNRKISESKNAKMSRHIQVESNMSLTGSNADNRVLVRPSEQGAAIAALYNEVAALLGAPKVSSATVNAGAADAFRKVAKDLVASQGKSLVISNSNNVAEQVILNKLNAILGNYNNTISFTNSSNQRQGNDSEFNALVQEMNSGGVDAIFIMGANPVFDSAQAEQFTAAFSKVKLSVSFNTTIDETTALCQYSTPNHHILESWGDAEPKKGHVSLVQPTIAPLFKTRQTEESLLRWCDSTTVPATSESYCYDYLRNHWQSAYFPKQRKFNTFQTFWDGTLHDGVFTYEVPSKNVNCSLDVSQYASQITKPSTSEIELLLTESIGVGAGQYTNNPWLQEMPDPVTRCVWGNTLAIPVEFDGNKNYKSFKDLSDGDQVEVQVNGKKVLCNVVRQFGQMKGTVAIALGYGRKQVGYAGKNVGSNVNPFMSVTNGYSQYFATDVKVSNKISHDKDFACVQYHHTLGVTGIDAETKKKINVDEQILGDKGFQGSLTKRSIFRGSHVSEIGKFTEDLVKEREHHQYLNKQTLYPGHADTYSLGHHWALHVDLNSCTGCGACTVACMSENNVPVVGKHEVHRHHEMSWLRIDRYFYGDVNNPKTLYQPMMCQHCDNAPCENVCPVNATNHSHDGLNQMTYNRCIGTRYCANNCPYKVRRFNWLDYTKADLFAYNEPAINNEDESGEMWGTDDLTRLVLNPDVTVRSRGVIEKCSFCVQRIQEGKLTAKKEGRALRDGDIKSACMTACPTGAIIFGDKNNPESLVSKVNKSDINYIVLEEINVAPNVTYSARIHNSIKELDA
ncbi:MAG: TAT-variant-translocated molybdopterin oxidoreductase [Saprospiraceae bacterium]|nr:TAT-variant-translocated molybdopterin oxidoreductase [Saprospiraceae bacterium]